MSKEVIHAEFIGTLSAIYRPNIYVELGCQHGYTLEQVAPNAKVLHAIDIALSPRLKETVEKYSNINLHLKTTDAFMGTFNEGIDMAFIDADHCYESAQRDFDNVLQKLNPGGLILLHDTDPEDDSLIVPTRCGDSYRIVKVLENRDDVNIVTLPIREAGLSIVTKKNNTRTAIRHQ